MKLPSLQATALAAVALFSSTILAIPASGRAWTVGQKVKTTGGILVGQEAQGASGVSEYLGIAYVVPPVGERRFKEPERYVSDREINAKNFVGNPPTPFKQSFSCQQQVTLNNITGLCMLAKPVASNQRRCEAEDGDRPSVRPHVRRPGSLAGHSWLHERGLPYAERLD